MVEKFRWLAGVIAAHGDRKVFGRTRLHKTIKLLQARGSPLASGTPFPISALTVRGSTLISGYSISLGSSTK